MARGWLQHLRESAIFKVEGLDPPSCAGSPRRRPTPWGSSWCTSATPSGSGSGPSAPASRWTWPGGPTCSSSPRGGASRRSSAFYREESRRADGVLDEVTSLDLPSRGEFRPTTFRWAVFHLIEEAARHVGHMDITRELLDGKVGR